MAHPLLKTLRNLQTSNFVDPDSNLKLVKPLDRTKQDQHRHHHPYHHHHRTPFHRQELKEKLQKKDEYVKQLTQELEQVQTEYTRLREETETLREETETLREETETLRGWARWSDNARIWTETEAEAEKARAAEAQAQAARVEEARVAEALRQKRQRAKAVAEAAAARAGNVASEQFTPQQRKEVERIVDDRASTIAQDTVDKASTLVQTEGMEVYQARIHYYVIFNNPDNSSSYHQVDLKQEKAKSKTVKGTSLKKVGTLKRLAKPDDDGNIWEVVPPQPSSTLHTAIGAGSGAAASTNSTTKVSSPQSTAPPQPLSPSAEDHNSNTDNDSISAADAERRREHINSPRSAAEQKKQELRQELKEAIAVLDAEIMS